MLSIPAVSFGATFYVDSAASSTSTPTGSRTSPLRTIAQVNALQLAPGDQVLFKCGSAWPASQETPTTLQLRHGVRYDSYATGGAVACRTPRPVLRGSVTLTGLSWVRHGGTTSAIYRADVSRIMGNLPLVQLMEPGSASSATRLTPARHPNAGAGSYAGIPTSRMLMGGPQTPAAPDGRSQYQLQLATATSPGARMPTGTNLSGASLYLKTYDWMITRFHVRSHSADLVNLELDDPFHQWPLSPRRSGDEAMGGYWLEGQRWMLDAPGEWFYDAGARMLYVWRRDGRAPGLTTTYRASVLPHVITAGMNGTRVDATHLANGFALRNLDVQEAALDGIAIMGDAFQHTRVQQFQIDGVNVTRTGRFGIVVRGVDGRSANPRPAIRNSTVTDTRADAITLETSREPHPAFPNGLWMGQGRGLDIVDNQIGSVGLDFFAHAAIRAGSHTRIQGNRIDKVGARGIDTGPSTLVERNHVTSSCLVVDDCGALYTDGDYVPDTRDMSSIWRSNIIDTVGGPGSADGRRSSSGPFKVGLYVDNYASKVTLQGNAVQNADIGFLINGGTSCTVQDNLMARNRLSNGALATIGHDDRTPGNNFVGANALVTDSLQQQAQHTLQAPRTESTRSFAQFTGNAYAMVQAAGFRDIFKDPISGEPQERVLDHAQWQTTGHDQQGPRPFLNLVAFAPVSGANLVGNGGFDQASNHWLPMDADSRLTYLSGHPGDGCVSGPCLRVHNEGPVIGQQRRTSTLYTFTPTFTVTAGRTYLLVLDARAEVSGDRLEAQLQRYASAGALSVYGQGFALETHWKRHMMPITATASSVNGDGRLDVRIQSLGAVWLDNVRLLEVTTTSNPEKNAVAVQVNPTRAAISVSCPATQSANCSQYRDLITGQAVTFPYSLPAMGHRTVVWSGSPWQDADADGVPDATDACPGTVPGSGANERGCGVGQ